MPNTMKVEIQESAKEKQNIVFSSSETTQLQKKTTFYDTTKFYLLARAKFAATDKMVNIQ